MSSVVLCWGKLKVDNNNDPRYYLVMIISFKDVETEEVFKGKRSQKLPPSIHRVAMRKLWMIDAAMSITDLRIPPGNRLEKLSGNLAGQYSIRINNQWRVCFSWQGGSAYNVLIKDYH